MRTIHSLSTATLRSSIITVVAVSLCVPGAFPQGSSDFSGPSANALFTARDFSQEGAAKTIGTPQTEVSYGYLSLSAEMRGDLMMIHQRYLSAISAYREAALNSPVVWNKMGIAYQHMYALDFAKASYEKAVELNPNYAEAINNLGTVYYGEKDYHKAERYYRKALKFKPECASFYSNLGTAFFAEHKYKQGVASYQRAFAIDPNVFLTETLERIPEFGPTEEQAKLNYTLAKMYAQAGNLEAALKYLRAALSEGFDDRKKLMEDKEFAALRATPQFHLLMSEEHIDDTAKLSTPQQ